MIHRAALISARHIQSFTHAASDVMTLMNFPASAVSEHALLPHLGPTGLIKAADG